MQLTIAERACRRCGEEIPADKRPDAIYCKPACRAQTNRDRWKARYPEKDRAAKRKYEEAHKDEQSERRRAWGLANLERRREQHRHWRAQPKALAKERERRKRKRAADPDAAYLAKKASHLWSNYRLRLSDYDELVLNQDSRCAICRKALGRFEFHVDHDHDTGRVRGLLCRRCNPMLGLALENTATLMAAVAYLETHR